MPHFFLSFEFPTAEEEEEEEEESEGGRDVTNLAH
jgi:hypothetical protein